jgi:hypothetical protein
MPRIRKPSPAIVVAMLALFVALSGIAAAATAVPLAKRALQADNAKKLSGKTLGQLTAASTAAAKAAADSAAAAAASQPGPASTAAGLVVVKTASGGQIPSGFFKELGSLSCDAGQKIMGGGLSSDGLVFTGDSYPVNDTTWAFSGANAGDSTANVSLWITCLK